MESSPRFQLTLKPHLHALKKSALHATPNFRHRADDFKARHSQFSTCKRIGPKCNVAPVLKILGVPLEVVSARVNEAPCQKFGVPRWFFLACVNGVSKFLFPCHCPWYKAVGFRFSSIFLLFDLRLLFPCYCVRFQGVETTKKVGSSGLVR